MWDGMGWMGLKISVSSSSKRTALMNMLQPQERPSVELSVQSLMKGVKAVEEEERLLSKCSQCFHIELC